jgi:oxalate---CoA ligase
LYDLIAGREPGQTDLSAILAQGRKPLSHGRLSSVIGEVREHLRAAGLGPDDRVAIVLPNGPEMAVALLASMSAAAAAPLNPNYSRAEFDFYLTDLEAGALIVEAGTKSVAVDAARSLGIPVIELEADPESEAGAFRLSLPPAHRPRGEGLPAPNGIALLLHTSGTTSKPKLVPLTRINLAASAGHVAESLGLEAGDRSLGVMPLFHIHGLVAGLMASLSAGGSIVCTSGFRSEDFFGWLRTFRPTWYSAVPAIHQAVLKRALEVPGLPSDHGLRFIRSCSSPLAPSVMSDLEKLFGVPVVEAYGMTEAAHQMACNPLPPLPRKPGSVGLPTGLAISILDEKGEALPRGTTGEVSIRGRSVTSGYLKNPGANAGAFTGGWFRTGDLGHLDEDGYLFLSGRLKEMINRGGEKISPREVDDVLLSHPHVAQAAAFAVPDERLGEDIAAAVVLKAGCPADEEGIRAHVAERLAFFKVPRRILFLAEIPKGPTGKVQRVNLAKQLGLSGGIGTREVPREDGAAAAVKDSGAVEGILGLMAKSLGKSLGPDDGFFDAGGDSIQAAALLADMETHFGVDIPIGAFIVNTTARRLAAIVERGTPAQSAIIVPVKRDGRKPPFFCVHPHDGRVSLYFGLAKRLEDDRPFYAFQAPSEEALKPSSGGIERMAERYIAEMRALRPDGPYLIGGYCFGATVAFEMARRLAAAGADVSRLVLMDGYAPGFPYPSSPNRFRGAAFSFIDRARRIGPLREYLSHVPSDKKKQYLMGLLRKPAGGSRAEGPALSGREEDAAWSYAPAPYAGSVVLIRPEREPWGFRKESAMGWDKYVSGELVVERVRGYHRSLIFKPHDRLLAAMLDRHLRRTDGRS